MPDYRSNRTSSGTLPGSMPFTLADFDYPLPPELVAQTPAAARSASRLLEVAGDRLADRLFADLPEQLAPGDLLVLNDTRVIPARLFGTKDTGGRIELLIERLLDGHEVLAHIRASHAPRDGSRLRIARAFDATVLGRENDLYRLRLETDESPLALLERHGKVPLPPYITHRPDATDSTRYQTVYARAPGAVAAPTAGLHFDEPLFARLAGRGVAIAYVTLHVGAGTFQPVRTENIAEHRMHSERYAIPEATIEAITAARARGKAVIAVGTTSLRTLEAAARHGALAAGSGETDLFITPGFEFRAVDRLITNFHLPKSTLMMLVAAFAGLERIRAAYAHAIARRYRFFSYGDAMLLDRESR